MERYFWGRFPIVRASSLFYYAKGGKVAQVLYAMKYHNRRTLCVKMGEWIGSELFPSGFFEGIDFLVPVPLFRTRLRQRGYNQSELLAMNVEGLFRATPEAELLRGKHILLVDDVLTTGATLTACADALSSIEGIRISIVTLAWAK